MPAKPALQVVRPGEKPKPRRDYVTRWGGDPSIMKDGHIGVPVQFLMHHATMKPFRLSIAEAMFVIQVMVFKWDEKAPFPGYKKVAKRMGISEVYARKLARSLQGKGFLLRIPRVGQTNAFDFTPLFTKLVAHAQAEAAKAAKQAKGRRAYDPFGFGQVAAATGAKKPKARRVGP